MGGLGPESPASFSVLAPSCVAYAAAGLRSGALSLGLHDQIELRPQLLDSRARVGAEVVGGVLGNSQRPFGLVHGFLAGRILPLLEGHQSVPKPEQLAAVGQPSGTLENVQEPVDTFSDIA